MNRPDSLSSSRGSALSTDAMPDSPGNLCTSPLTHWIGQRTDVFECSAKDKNSCGFSTVAAPSLLSLVSIGQGRASISFCHVTFNQGLRYLFSFISFVYSSWATSFHCTTFVGLLHPCSSSLSIAVY